jgi:hypothetical protein
MKMHNPHAKGRFEQLAAVVQAGSIIRMRTYLIVGIERFPDNQYEMVRWA